MHLAGEGQECGFVIVDDYEEIVRTVRPTAALVGARPVMEDRGGGPPECASNVPDQLLSPGTDRGVQTRRHCGAQAGVSYHRRRRIPALRSPAQPPGASVRWLARGTPVTIRESIGRPHRFP